MNELERYKQKVADRLHALTPFLQKYAMGEFSETLQIPDVEDEFTELIVGISLMVDDFREIIQELQSAEDNLQQRYEAIQLTNRSSNRFHNLSLDQIDQGINEAMQEVALFVGANRSSLFSISDDLITLTNTHEWCASPDDSQIEMLQGIPFETFGAHANTLKKHEIISISTIDDYPPEASAEKEWVEQHGFRSLLFVPLLLEGKLLGAVGLYGAVGDEISWSDINVNLLQLIGDIIVVTLNRRKVEQSNTRLGRILEDSLNEIYIFDAETLKFSSVNRGAQKNLGYSLEELAEMTPLDIKPAFNLDSFSEMLQPLRLGHERIIKFETHHRRKDGSTYDVEVHLQFDKTAHNPAFVAIILDISERKEAADKLAKHVVEVERFNRMAIGREHRMIELKREVNALANELDRDEPYDLSYTD
jgi:PAS domain S-box-containing protein